MQDSDLTELGFVDGINRDFSRPETQVIMPVHRAAAPARPDVEPNGDATDTDSSEEPDAPIAQSTIESWAAGIPADRFPTSPPPNPDDVWRIEFLVTRVFSNADPQGSGRNHVGHFGIATA
jgi:hypothetical protein